MSTSPEERTEPTAMAALPLPSELIYEILTFLGPLDVLSFGRTCHHHLYVVNEDSKRLSDAIIKQERLRITSETHPPSLAGLSLVSAIRSWMLYHGIFAERSIWGLALRIGNAYVMANRIILTGNDRNAFTRLVEYLLHLNCRVHYSKSEHEGPESSKSPTHLECGCAVCRITPSVNGEPHSWVEAEVRHFGMIGWDNDIVPITFLYLVVSDHVRVHMSEQSWLKAIRDIVKEPIEDPNHIERGIGNRDLQHRIRLSLRTEVWSAEHIFQEMTGLPRLQADLIYVPKVDLTRQRCGRWWPLLRRQSRGARAVVELSLRMYGGFFINKKMLDPKNRLLVAAVHAEMHALPRAAERGR